MEGLLVIVSGPSGSGKGTVVKQLDPNHGYALSISVTTRQPRPGEQDGREYFFATKDEFRKLRDENNLLEYTKYVGNYYGTPRKYVEEQISQGTVVLLEIEVDGALQVKEKFPDAVLIFLVAPSISELEQRLAGRKTEDTAEVQSRLQRALEELELVDKYDYLVINDDVQAAVERVNAIVKAERLKPARCRAEIQHFLKD